MRLKNIYYLCKKQLPLVQKLPFEKLEVNVGGNKLTKHRYNKWDKYLHEIDELKSVECLLPNIYHFKTYELSVDNQGNLILDGSEYSKFNVEINKLVLKMQTIVDLCESMGYSPDENGFDIKLPDNMDFNDFSECVKDINTAFSQNPYLNQDGDRIEFKALDIGSNWLTFTAICTGADLILNRLAIIIDKALHIRSHKITCGQQIEQLKGAQAKNELLETISSAYKEATELLLDKAKNELAIEISPLEPDGEIRLKHSLDLLSDWMTKGMEIYSSIDAPDEIKALFPLVEKQKLSKTDVKRLTEKSESENNE